MHEDIAGSIIKVLKAIHAIIDGSINVLNVMHEDIAGSIIKVLKNDA